MKITSKIIDSLELGKKKTMSPIFVILVSLFISAFVVSNIIACKSVLLFGLSVGGDKLSIASSFLVFPITYIISDVFSEVYGYAWSRKISWIAFFVNLVMVGLISIAVIIPGTDSSFDAAFESVLGSSFGIVMASQFAFMAGDFLNDRLFRLMKKKDTRNTDFGFLVRSICSSLAGEILDSLIFLPLLYLSIGGFGTIITGFWQFVLIVCSQGIIKTIVEIIGAPLELLVVNWVKKVEKTE